MHAAQAWRVWCTFERMISGARYSGVPHRVHVRPLILFAKPKSVIYMLEGGGLEGGSGSWKEWDGGLEGVGIGGNGGWREWGLGWGLERVKGWRESDGVGWVKIE